MTAERTFVGFGFGPIQAGLYLFEAQASGAFGRLVVAYRRPEVIAALRRAGGCFTLNIAHEDGVERAEVGPVEVYDVNDAADRGHIVRAVAEAEEIATAVSSIRDYRSPGPGSPHRLLEGGLRLKAERGGPRAVVYASENHTEAADILAAHVFKGIPDAQRGAARKRVRFLDTVIGKMCRTVAGAEVLETGLSPLTQGGERAFLVERYRHILVSEVRFPEPFRRALPFEETRDLSPFEAAKLYGHNAVHALAAYLGAVLGVRYIADLGGVPGMPDFLRAAALEESGAALLRRYGGCAPMFTREGYREFMEGLLTRMMNPHLRDTVARVGRDPARKLGWDDRLVGTVRLALREGIEPRRFALGVAAALEVMAPESPETAPVLLEPLWHGTAQEGEKRRVLARVERAREDLRRWRAAGWSLKGLSGPDL